MQDMIATRMLIELESADGIIRGTCHRTDNDDGGASKQDPVGIVFLSGLSATRASTGDAAVYWAEAFAARGYPTFRLDLPGCGDADGDPPAEWVRFVNGGGHASVVSSAITELVSRFRLSGVVLAGHCAGAVSAIYAAGASAECKGLLLLEPYFHVPQNAGTKMRQQLSRWASGGRCGGMVLRVYSWLKGIRLFLRGKLRPANRNVALLRCWKKVASTGLPILILTASGRKAPGIRARAGEFAHMQYVMGIAGRRSRAIAEVIDGAHHSFANRLGRVAVRRHMESWLDAHFPLRRRGEGSASPIGNYDEAQSLDDLQQSLLHAEPLV